MQSVGIIGLGLVGGALAERVISQGWSVIGFDVNSAQRDALTKLGGQAAATSTEVAQSADIIVLSLPTSDIVATVLAEIAPALRGKIILDTTTGEPEAMAACGRRLAEQGCDYLDATIAGSSAQVRRGEVIVMLGGPAAAVQVCQPLVAALSRQSFHLGEWGAGARMKLVVNLVLGLNRAVLAEGLAFAKASGVNPRQALEVLSAGPAFSRVMETKGERMLTGNFAPDARLAQHAKDVGLILEQAKRSEIRLPIIELHQQLLSRLIGEGLGELDNSVIIRAFETPSPSSAG